MEIKSISKKIFRTPEKTAENRSNQTNPFGVSFKGNIISADVFETSEKSSISFKGAELAANFRNKCEISAAAFAGSIGNMNKAISTRFNSLVSFGKRIGEKTVNFGKYLNETRLAINIGNPETPFGIRFRLNQSDSIYKPKNLRKLGVADLESMFKETAETARNMEAA